MTSPIYFFCGIGGSGMSALAQVMRARGFAVAGSDRGNDQGQGAEKFAALQAQGIRLFPQDGSGVRISGATVLVVSTAVEDSVPDVKAAKELGLRIQKRAELLAEVFNATTGIAVGGTSGKSTVTAMVGHILRVCGKSPTVINGAVMRTASASDQQAGGLQNVLLGSSDLCVIESDESDGTIDFYTPSVALVNNITLDHKPIEELRPLFLNFMKRARTGVVANADCAETMALVQQLPADEGKQVVTFSVQGADASLRATDFVSRPDGVSFTLHASAEMGAGAAPLSVSLAVPGKHNVANALAAMGAALLAGVPLKEAAAAMSSFAGVKRRMEVLGTANGVTVIDDFGHNPDKIAASLATLKEFNGRVLVMYQPHGFGPTKFLRTGLVQAFVDYLGAEDEVFLPEIYFAGGTADKSISSADLVADICSGDKTAHFVPNRTDILPLLLEKAKAGDRVVVMGARDDTLTVFGLAVLAGLETASSAA